MRPLDTCGHGKEIGAAVVLGSGGLFGWFKRGARNWLVAAGVGPTMGIGSAVGVGWTGGVIWVDWVMVRTLVGAMIWFTVGQFLFLMAFPFFQTLYYIHHIFCFLVIFDDFWVKVCYLHGYFFHKGHFLFYGTTLIMIILVSSELIPDSCMSGKLLRERGLCGAVSIIL